MANTDREFSSMLNEYLPDELLMEELIKRDYFLTQIAKDEDWKGGDAIVPFRGAQASSIKFGGLTASNDIAQSKYVRGKIQGYKEVWGSLIFNEADLVQHDGGKVHEGSFLKILPDEIEDFSDNFKEVVSHQLGCGGAMATVTDATNAATGKMIVDRIDRFIIRQKLTLDDGNSATVSVYVTAIDVNTNEVTVSATRDGSALDVSAYTVAQGAKFYYDGSWDGTNFDSFLSLRKALLSAANGGDATLHGQTKLAYPYLQAININGGVGGLAISATNILDKLFDAYTTIRTKARGKATDIVMSYKHLGSIMKLLQTVQGAYRAVNEPNHTQYGWTEITIAQVGSGQVLKVVGVQEMDDDVIFFIDWSTIKFLSNGGFRKRRGPDGENYFVIRNTTGYQYVIDTCLYGDMKYVKPSNNGVIHSISY